MINSIIKGALALMYHMIRKPQQNPVPQVGKRFNALYSTVRPGVRPPTADLDPVIDFKDAASWSSTKGLDTIFLNALLAAENHETVGPTEKAFIAQSILISSFTEMTPYLTMKVFVNEGLSKASLLLGVASEIKAFIEAERALRQLHGDDALFPYLKALRLQGHEVLPPPPPHTHPHHIPIPQPHPPTPSHPPFTFQTFARLQTQGREGLMEHFVIINQLRNHSQH